MRTRQAPARCRGGRAAVKRDWAVRGFVRIGAAPEVPAPQDTGGFLIEGEFTIAPCECGSGVGPHAIRDAEE
jgi:hypothetical protein